MKPLYYDCCICGGIHPWEWDGDCRDDANRFNAEDLDAKYGPLGWELLYMTDRVEADQYRAGRLGGFFKRPARPRKAPRRAGRFG